MYISEELEMAKCEECGSRYNKADVSERILDLCGIWSEQDLGDLCFADETYKKATLYVPQGSMAAYKSARDWKNFSNIVEK